LPQTTLLRRRKTLRGEVKVVLLKAISNVLGTLEDGDEDETVEKGLGEACGLLRCSVKTVP
jgi:hypothetical protein